MTSSFVQLHVHSSYSPMAGIPSLPALCLAAQQQGASALALTDTNGLYGIIRFVQLAREGGFRPLIGTELVHRHHRAVLLAASADGYSNLCRLISARHCDEHFDFIDAVRTHRHVAKHKRLAVALDDLKRRFGSMVVKWGGSTGRGEK